MQAASAYLSAVFTASAIIAPEWFLFEMMVNWWEGRGFPLKDWSLFPGAMLLTSVIVFAIGSLIALAPFLVFYPVYRKLQPAARQSLAIGFGLAMACAGMSLTFGTMLRGPLGELPSLALMSVLPGIASGWVFYKITAANPAAEPDAGSNDKAAAT